MKPNPTLASWKQRLRKLFQRFGLDISLHRGKTDQDKLGDIFLAITQIRELDIEDPVDNHARFLDYCCRMAHSSKAQLFQDLLVLYLLKEKRNGYFVEFGACDGLSLNNTYLLENAYGWRGIVAEPARVWRDALARNRNCITDFRCVWKKSGEHLSFSEAGILSTLTDFVGHDAHEASRAGARRYDVETVSLEDLLVQHGAPQKIDYLSVDTEGSEYEIMRAFDFGKYDISIITIEHNFSEPDRSSIRDLLGNNGYRRIFTAFSHWDDWYIKEDLNEPNVDSI